MKVTFSALAEHLCIRHHKLRRMMDKDKYSKSNKICNLSINFWNGKTVKAVRFVNAISPHSFGIARVACYVVSPHAISYRKCSVTSMNVALDLVCLQHNPSDV